jgi:hypothetical protein
LVEVRQVAPKYILLVPEELGLDSVSVLIMTAKRHSPEGPIVDIFLPQFLAHCQKSETSFNLTSLSHILTKVNVIRTQTDLTHCYSGAYRKQPPICFWCEGGHHHQQCLVAGYEIAGTAMRSIHVVVLRRRVNVESIVRYPMVGVTSLG